MARLFRNILALVVLDPIADTDKVGRLKGILDLDVVDRVRVSVMKAGWALADG